MNADLWWRLFSRLLALALAIFAILQTRRILNRMRDKRGRLPAVVDEKRPDQIIEGSRKLQGVHEGIEYQCESNPGTEGTPPFLVLSMMQETEGDFMVGEHEPKGWLRRRLKAWGVSFVKTGDDDFDRNYDVVTERSPGFASACFQSPECRDAVGALSAMGFNALRNDGRGIDAIRANIEHDDMVDGSLAREAMSHLSTLCRGWSQIRARRMFKVRLDTVKWVAAFAIPAAFLLLGVASGLLSFAIEMRQVESLVSFTLLVLPLAVPMLLVWAAVSFRLARGRYNSHLYILTVWFVSIAAVWLFLTTNAEILNAVLDRGEPSRHVQRILAFQRDEQGNGYDIQILSWLPAETTREIFLNQYEYDRCPDDFDRAIALEITTRPGFFGLEWISQFRPLGPDDFPPEAKIRDRS